ncbi:hypothetical protein BVRB_021170 [Beta vulgaris subsp. vulgaris]|uniref:Uncharacterized protein n=1 Tax=Beta vulgaris subsp. vulgaris TaxID=3555 RepID=A0A0J8B3N1_BETVV|nr:hypothetical protein BVRB_021170 [Beta vulgaris subsp. vulgaris]
MLLAPSLNDDLVYESRLNAVIFAFTPPPRRGTRCLRRYLDLLVKIRQMHTMLRRKTLLDVTIFVRQMQWYCDVAYIAHAALQEVGNSEELLQRLSIAGNDRRAYG